MGIINKYKVNFKVAMLQEGTSCIMYKTKILLLPIDFLPMGVVDIHKSNQGP